MSWTTLIFIVLIMWMLRMHVRPGGHDGRGSHSSHTGSATGGENDGD